MMIDVSTATAYSKVYFDYFLSFFSLFSGFPLRLRTLVRTGRERFQDNSKAGGGGNAVFSWRETERCFWAAGVLLGGKAHDHLGF